MGQSYNAQGIAACGRSLPRFVRGFGNSRQVAHLPKRPRFAFAVQMQVHSGLGQNVQRPFVVHRPLVAFGSHHIGHGGGGVGLGSAQRQIAGRAHQLLKLRGGAGF